MEYIEELRKRLLEFRAKQLALDAKWNGSVPPDVAEAALCEHLALAEELQKVFFAENSAVSLQEINWPDWLAYYVVPSIVYYLQYQVRGPLNGVALSMPGAGKTGPVIQLAIGGEQYGINYENDFDVPPDEPDGEARRECYYAASALWQEYMRQSQRDQKRDIEKLAEEIQKAFPGTPVSILM